MGNPKTTPYDYFFRAGGAAAPTLGIGLVPALVETVADLEPTIDTLAREPNGG
jgi:hypothetical protein